MSIDMVKGEKDWRRKNKTAVIEVSLDIRDLAYIIACYHASGVPISSKLAAVSIALSQFIEMLPRAFPNIPRLTSTAEAKAVVEESLGHTVHYTCKCLGLLENLQRIDQELPSLSLVGAPLLHLDDPTPDLPVTAQSPTPLRTLRMRKGANAQLQVGMCSERRWLALGVE